MSTLEKPRPRIGPDSAPFWEGCKAHELRLPFCVACGKAHWPAAPICPQCLSTDIAWCKTSGRGRIMTWTLVHKAWFASFAAEIPYNVVQVELEEGPRLTANLVHARPADLAIGRSVEAMFDDIDAELTMLRFRPAPA